MKIKDFISTFQHQIFFQDLLLIVIFIQHGKTRHAGHNTLWNLAHKVKLLCTEIFTELCNGKYDLPKKKIEFRVHAILLPSSDFSVTTLSLKIEVGVHAFLLPSSDFSVTTLSLIHLPHRSSSQRLSLSHILLAGTL